MTRTRGGKRETTSGEIVTFYSYKGGSGRSMALANVAWALASNGNRVLVIDWDLEAPGLHRYFHPFLADPGQVRSDGVIDRLWEYAQLLVSGDGDDRDPLDLADFTGFVQPLDLPSDIKGKLDFLGAGRQGDDYGRKVGGFDWNAFYSEFGAGAFFAAMATWARDSYDYILIDSRTGVSDSAGVCTVQLPDVVVLCFIYNRQSIEGTAAVARSILRQRRTGHARPPRLVVSPMRVEDNRAVPAARRHAAQMLCEVLADPPSECERILRIHEIAHYHWCACEEKLAIFEEEPEKTSSLLRDMHGLASRITGKELQPVGIDRQRLDALWRRVAFADPRLEELDTVGKDLSAPKAVARLREWLAETLDDGEAREDWLEGLADACGTAALSLTPQTKCESFAPLSQGSVDLARRLWRGDAERFAHVLVRTLDRRFRYLRLNDRLLEGLKALNEALSVVEGVRQTPGRLFIKGRLLVDIGDLVEKVIGASAAIPWRQRAANAYRELPEKALPTKRRDLAVIINDLAGALLETGRADEALQTAQEAVDILTKRDGPLWPMAWMTLAQACNAVGNVERGLAIIDEVIENLRTEQTGHFPQQAHLVEALTIRGSLLMALDRLVEAENALEQAWTAASALLNIHGVAPSTTFRLHATRARLLNRLGRFAELVSEVEAALEGQKTRNLSKERLELLKLQEDACHTLGWSDKVKRVKMLQIMERIESIDRLQEGPNFLLLNHMLTPEEIGTLESKFPAEIDEAPPGNQPDSGSEPPES